MSHMPGAEYPALLEINEARARARVFVIWLLGLATGAACEAQEGHWTEPECGLVTGGGLGRRRRRLKETSLVTAIGT